ncbi:ECF transporter S component [Lactiplantibacillus pentosus]|uniref:ECF transporter S component n=1 Tax=Lactiplantibacillus pentosus TaxID=1589 RepID=UPI003C2291A1
MGDSHVSIRYISLIGLLTAICTVLRIFKLPIPNVQPVTDIIMIVTLKLGGRYGMPLAVLTMVVSNVYLGFGLWTLPQILAYVICILTIVVLKRIAPINRWVWIQLPISAFLGFEYGLVVSSGMVLVGSVPVFWGYYLSGLPFDFYHALGNVCFYPLLLAPLTKMLQRYTKTKVT